MPDKRVMIVDPNMYNRMVLSNILVTNGYSVCSEVRSCREALDNYEKARPDLVLIEAQMPDKDGVVTTSELIHKYDSCRILLMASAGQRSQVCAAMSAGAIGFIPKPINERRVVNTLRKVS